MRLMSAMFVRVGLAMLVLGLLVRLMPIPNRADVVADDLAIAVSLLLILVASVYLRLTRDKELSDVNTPYSTLRRHP
jgi:formate hydrogenlyase subunit 3/multisubunit Na+/H+ antiporter MnhD subunit